MTYVDLICLVSEIKLFIDRRPCNLLEECAIKTPQCNLVFQEDDVLGFLKARKGYSGEYARYILDGIISMKLIQPACNDNLVFPQPSSS